MKWVQVLVTSIIGAAALTYAAAFNLVGWRFLLPGRYSFGVVCAVSMVVVTTTGLVRVAAMTRSRFTAVVCGVISVLAAERWLFEGAALAFKDFFIWGLPVCVLMAVLLAKATVPKLLALVRDVSMLIVALRGVTLWTLIVLVYVISDATNATEDVRIFMRQQMYVVAVSVVVSVALIFWLKLALAKKNAS